MSSSIKEFFITKVTAKFRFDTLERMNLAKWSTVLLRREHHGRCEIYKAALWSVPYCPIIKCRKKDLVSMFPTFLMILPPLVTLIGAHVSDQNSMPLIWLGYLIWWKPSTFRSAFSTYMVRWLPPRIPAALRLQRSL
jgi:hypothetical protein